MGYWKTNICPLYHKEVEYTWNLIQCTNLYRYKALQAIMVVLQENIQAIDTEPSLIIYSATSSIQLRTRPDGPRPDCLSEINGREMERSWVKSQLSHFW